MIKSIEHIAMMNNGFSGYSKEYNGNSLKKLITTNNTSNTEVKKLETA